ncbi:MAG TPA: nucleotidyltransferase family protein [Pyrinomonadaceae bacterium]|jgi:molybdenum cofactor cytidylyltransferase|nr:nucleotidyltransferase family protein [Pyrinomonadaceae bacterium]
MSGPAVGIIVLAAGASSRMGEPKQLLRHEGETLLGRAVRVALGTRCRPLVVVLGSDSDEMLGEAAAAEARVVVNEAWAEGMASSIRRGLLELEASAPAGVEAAVLTLCDQPFVSAEILERLVDVYRRQQATLVASEYESGGERVRGVPALFGRLLFPELMELRGAEGARRVIARHSASCSTIRVPEAAFDIDTPKDYLALRGHSR